MRAAPSRFPFGAATLADFFRVDIKREIEIDALVRRTGLPRGLLKRYYGSPDSRTWIGRLRALGREQGP